jgi:DNA-binding transcriptional regulator WhiA
MSPALQEMARARKANPDLNLSELAARMKLSKSAINHRLRRLVEIAEGSVDAEHHPTSVGKAS